MTMDCSEFDATGSSARPSANLAAGLWFWRLVGRVGTSTGTQTSHVWQFSVGARSAAVDTSWGTILDANGDGYADLIVGALGVGRAYVYYGSATGVSATPTATLTGPDGADGRFGFSVASAGDVNGDGYADLVVGAYNVNSGTGRAYVYHGSASGVFATPSATLSGPDGTNGYFGYSVASAGDVNGDGYADPVVLERFANSNTGRAYAYHRSASGISIAATTSRSDADGGFFDISDDAIHNHRHPRTRSLQPTTAASALSSHPLSPHPSRASRRDSPLTNLRFVPTSGLSPT
jgi:hypothetical protein